ncbi:MULTISPECIES: fimbrial protein [Stenotrophomonas]|uniref:Type 1 fimbrial protein n=1 Tax=Stenotrophomonas maltophilia TaxID=40324 RepID=A0A431UDV2_STEMA|nr:fimbrial protein [Stenotrophomonas maltophilia]RTQ87498.1 type 1 fimbrial protein [Stenotrophomonas maltophilia]
MNERLKRAKGYARRATGIRCLPGTILLFAGLMLTGGAEAACRINLIGGIFFDPQEVLIDAGYITVLPSTPIGGLIKQISGGIHGKAFVAQCDLWGGKEISVFENPDRRVAVPGLANVYTTDVPGIGVRVMRSVSGGSPFFYPHSQSHSVKPGWLGIDGGSFIIDLVRTAEQIGTGRVAPTGTFTRFYYDGNSTSNPALTSKFSSNGNVVVKPTCEVDAGSRNIPVAFDNVPANRFNGPRTRGDNRDFSIKLLCQGGARETRVKIRIDATPDDSGYQGVLKLDNVQNRASGVGIEMVRRSGTSEVPFSLGDPLVVGFTQPTASTLELPLRARYIQTREGAVGPGVANGKATFTLQYD